LVYRSLLPAMRRAATALLLVVSMIVAAAAAGELGEDQGESMESESPVLIFIQGKLRPDGAALYEKYLEGTRPLMAEYGIGVLAVGSGLASEHSTEEWPINAVLTCPDLEAAEGFLSDPRYLEIKNDYRDRAYETLRLSLVASRPSRIRTPKAVAEEAFGDFRGGLRTGEWEPFLERLSDDFTLRFPTGDFQGEHRGKDRAEAFFRYVSEAFPEGLEITELERVTAEENRVVFEFRDEGLLRGEPYRNLVAISFDVCGELLCGYREYFGLVGPPPTTKEGSE
jgi:uncharacterized protein (DUF1330 family)